MATPLKVKNVDGDIQEFTTSDENYLAYQIGLHLLDDSANGFGSLTKNDSADTLVGNFSNTFFNEPVGTHPSTSITSGSTSTFLSQSSGTAVETDSDTLLALKWMDSSVDGPAGFRQFSDTDLNTAVDRYLSTVFTNNYPGSFYLADSAPSADYSVHLTNVFTDTRTDGTSIPYNVYRRDTMTPPSTVRPMFVEDSAGGSGIALREMNDRQIRFSFGQRAKTRIGTSKIGTYQLRSSTAGAPTDPGTWVAKGTAIDTKQTTSQRDYLLSSDEVYQAEYARNYTPEYTASYARTFDAQYDRNIPYIANYTNEFGLGYTPQPAYTSSTSYTGGIGYARLFNNVNITPDGTFADIDTAVFYVKNDGAYASVVPTLVLGYTGPLNYENTSTSYEAAQYQANIASYEIGSRSYAGTGTTNYTLSYTAAVPGYLSQYVGDNLYNHDTAQYQGQTDYIPSYVGPGLVQYDHTLAGYVGPYASYDGYARALLYYTTGTYTGESYYIGEEGTPGYASEGTFYESLNFAYQSSSYGEYQATYLSNLVGVFNISALYSNLNSYVGDQSYTRTGVDTNVYSSVFADGAVSYTTELMTYTAGGTGVDGDGVYTGPGGTYLELTTYYVSDLGSFADGASQYSSALESYTANVFYQRDPDPSYTRNYAGFNKFYNTGVGYTGPDSFLKNTFNTYVGPTLVYDGETQYINPEGYILTDPYAPEYVDNLPRTQREYVRAADIEQYLRLYTRSFGEVFQANTSYAPTYTQPVIPYSATYTAPEYTGPGTDTYVGPGNFTPPPQYYTGAEDVLYIVDNYYQSNYTQTYTAPSVEYTRFYTARFEQYSLLYTGQDQSYTSTTPAASYTTTDAYSIDVARYTGTLGYASPAILTYIGLNVSYGGPGQYVGPNRFYIAPGEVLGYTRNQFANPAVTSFYAGASYQRQTIGDTAFNIPAVYASDLGDGILYTGPETYLRGEGAFYAGNRVYTGSGVLFYAGLGYAGPNTAFTGADPLSAYLQNQYAPSPGTDTLNYESDTTDGSFAGYTGGVGYLSAQSFIVASSYQRNFIADFPSFNGFQGGTHYLKEYTSQLASYNNNTIGFYDSTIYVGASNTYQPSEYALNLYTRNQTPFADANYVGDNPVSGAYLGANYTLSYARDLFVGSVFTAINAFGGSAGLYLGDVQYQGTQVYEQTAAVDTAYVDEVGIQYVRQVADAAAYAREVTYITTGPDYTRETSYLGAGPVRYTSANYDTYVSNTQVFAARYDLTSAFATEYESPIDLQYLQLNIPTYTGDTIETFTNTGLYVGGYIGYTGNILFSDYISYQGVAPAEYLRESQYAGPDAYTRDPVYYVIDYTKQAYTGITISPSIYDGFDQNYTGQDGTYGGLSQTAYAESYQRAFADIGIFTPVYTGGPLQYYELEGAGLADYVVHQLFIGGTYTRELYAGPTLYENNYTAPGTYVGGDTPEGVVSFQGDNYTRIVGPTTAFGPGLNPGIIYSPTAYVGPIADTNYSTFYIGPNTSYAGYTRGGYGGVYAGAPQYAGSGGSFARVDEIYQGSYASYIPLGYLGTADVSYAANYTSGAEPHYVNQYTGPAQVYQKIYEIEDTRITDEYLGSGGYFAASSSLYAAGEYSRLLEYTKTFGNFFATPNFGLGNYTGPSPLYESTFGLLYQGAYLNYLGANYNRDFAAVYQQLGYDPGGSFSADYTGPAGPYEAGYDATATYTGFDIDYYLANIYYNTANNYTRYPYEGTAFQNYTTGATSTYQADLYTGSAELGTQDAGGYPDNIITYAPNTYVRGPAGNPEINYTGPGGHLYDTGTYVNLDQPDHSDGPIAIYGSDYYEGSYGVALYVPGDANFDTIYNDYAPFRHLYARGEGGGFYLGDHSGQTYQNPKYDSFTGTYYGTYISDVSPRDYAQTYLRSGVSLQYGLYDGQVSDFNHTEYVAATYVSNVPYGDHGYDPGDFGGYGRNIKTFYNSYTPNTIYVQYGGDPYTGPAPGIAQYAGPLDTIYYTGDRTVISSFIPNYNVGYVTDKAYLDDLTNISYEGESQQNYTAFANYISNYTGAPYEGRKTYLGILGPTYNADYSGEGPYNKRYTGGPTGYQGDPSETTYVGIYYSENYTGSQLYIRGFNIAFYSGLASYTTGYSNLTDYNSYMSGPTVFYDTTYTEPDRAQYSNIVFAGFSNYNPNYTSNFGVYGGPATTSAQGAYGAESYAGPAVLYEGSVELVFNRPIYNPNYAGGGKATGFAAYLGTNFYMRTITGFGDYVPETHPGMYTGLVDQSYYELTTVFVETFVETDSFAGYLRNYTIGYLSDTDYTRHYENVGPTFFDAQYIRSAYYDNLGREAAPAYDRQVRFIRKYEVGYIGNAPTYSAGYTGFASLTTTRNIYSYSGPLYTSVFAGINLYNREQNFYEREIIESFTPGAVYQANYTTDVTYASSNYTGTYQLSYLGDPLQNYTSIVTNYGGYVRSNVYASTYIGDVIYEGSTDYVPNVYGRFSAPIYYVQRIYAGYLGDNYEGYLASDPNVGTFYTGIGSETYSGPPILFESLYNRAGVSLSYVREEIYTIEFGSAAFTASFGYTGVGKVFTGTYDELPYVRHYVLSYTLEPIPYTKENASSYLDAGILYTGPRVYNLGPGYIGPGEDQYLLGAGYYNRGYIASYDVNYTRTFVDSYTKDDTYTNAYVGQYARVETQFEYYQVFYTNLAFYIAEQYASGQYAGPLGLTYGVNVQYIAAEYEGDAPYLIEYIGPGYIPYEQEYLTDYTGSYVGNFEGLTIDSDGSETIETYTLYVRIA